MEITSSPPFRINLEQVEKKNAIKRGQKEMCTKRWPFFSFSQDLILFPQVKLLVHRLVNP